MITKGRNYLFLMAIGFAVVIALMAPEKVCALEFHPLLEDSALTCSGSQVGVVLQLEQQGQVSMLVLILKGTANTTRQLFYVCSTGPCHGTACGFTSVGTVATNARGIGFAFKKFSNPFPGSGMHWDICPGSTSGCSGSNYWSGFFTNPFDSTQGGSPDPSDPAENEHSPVISGDPASR